MSWSPLPKFSHGKIIKPFTPLDNPNISSNQRYSDKLKNIYPGDLVYIFETCTTYRTWARGYLVSQLNPSDFSLANVSLDVVPETKIDIVIFPMSHVQIIREVEIIATDEEIQKITSEHGLNMYNNESSDQYSLSSSNFTTGGSSSKKTQRPALPTNDYALSIKSLLDEIEAALRSLNVHIFALYTRGDLTYFKKMVRLFDDLEEIKLNFKYNLMTKEESRRAKKKTAYLLTLISRIVAAQGGKRSIKDVAGYESILARDDITGELFVPAKEDYRNKLSGFARIAQNQVFGALLSLPISLLISRIFPGT
ncbi:unnamed protein product [Ambrosiozyma monospora]|uniref:Unnamed protein product n=1 Tax=Ambrosiozyma monospora TaxID=43982 RepID=A0A9W7DIV6_AMBMO|nr:unnamed protein product [Ambrosiozyma monospora]